MKRGTSCGGGQSSLGYLFGGAETVKAAPAAKINRYDADDSLSVKSPAVTSPRDKGIPAGISGSSTNNYYRADGQNCGNFITERPSRKVTAAPGGGSSLGYLFGGDAS